jgi:hypothetical protein
MPAVKRRGRNRLPTIVSRDGVARLGIVSVASTLGVKSMKLKISMFLFALGLSSASAFAVDDAAQCRYDCHFWENKCVKDGGNVWACQREYETCFMECMHI